MLDVVVIWLRRQVVAYVAHSLVFGSLLVVGIVTNSVCLGQRRKGSREVHAGPVGGLDIMQRLGVVECFLKVADSSIEITKNSAGVAEVAKGDGDVPQVLRCWLRIAQWGVTRNRAES